MNKKIPVIIGSIVIAIIIGVTLPFLDEETKSENESKVHDYVVSGPLAVTQYEHRLGDDVFLIVSGLQPNEKGNLFIYTPKGVLFKTIPYDGSKKSDFKQYFYPDTFKPLNICTPEDLIGIWKIVFEDGSYQTLEFEMTDEWIQGAEASITVVC